MPNNQTYGSHKHIQIFTNCCEKIWKFLGMGHTAEKKNVLNPRKQTSNGHLVRLQEMAKNLKPVMKNQLKLRPLSSVPSIAEASILKAYS